MGSTERNSNERHACSRACENPARTDLWGGYQSYSLSGYLLQLIHGNARLSGTSSDSSSWSGTSARSFTRWARKAATEWTANCHPRGFSVLTSRNEGTTLRFDFRQPSLGRTWQYGGRLNDGLGKPAFRRKLPGTRTSSRMCFPLGVSALSKNRRQR